MTTHPGGEGRTCFYMSGSFMVTHSSHTHHFTLYGLNEQEALRTHAGSHKAAMDRYKDLGEITVVSLQLLCGQFGQLQWSVDTTDSGGHAPEACHT